MKISIEKNIEIEDIGENAICWRAIPIQYDDYLKEKSDKYAGYVFGDIFDSPHYLYRRFHKNYCKAYAISNLLKYDIKKDEENVVLDEVNEYTETDLDLRVLSYHHSLVFLVSCFEAFLKDVFIECLNLKPEKIGSYTLEKIVRKYNFQNIDSTNKAYNWLFDEQIAFISEKIKDALELRHKIVHESFYKINFSNEQLEKYFFAFLIEADGIHFFLEVHGYYRLINSH